MLPPDLDEGLVGALNDALTADIDPRAGRHLAEHHQACTVELVEFLECRPVGHDVGVGDQDPRRIGVGAEHADRLARLDQQGLVVFEALQRAHDAVVALPVARRPADAAIDHQFLGLLGDLGVQIVHQHAHWRFGQPAFAAQLVAVRRANFAGVVEAAVLGRAVAHGICSGWGDRGRPVSWAKRVAR